MLMQRSWLKKPLFEGEDEGGSGGGGGEDRIAALEARLARMTNMLSSVVDNQQNDKVRNQLGQVEQQILTKIRDSESAETAAEAALATAFDEADGAAVAKAQRKLTEATAARIEAQNDHRSYKARVAEGEKRQGGSDGPVNLDTTNLEGWKQRHASWYGVDKDMTAKAHQIDGQIRAAGVHPVGSVEYFNAIDREMRRLYPDKLTGSPSTAGGNGGASPQRGGSSRVAASVMEGWRRMGINTSDPKVVARMLQHREGLVSKGILPAQPVTGAIRGA